MQDTALRGEAVTALQDTPLQTANKHGHESQHSELSSAFSPFTLNKLY